MLNLQLTDEAQGDTPADEAKLQGKPDKTLRFSLCSDNLEGISEGVYFHNNQMLVSKFGHTHRGKSCQQCFELCYLFTLHNYEPISASYKKRVKCFFSL